MLENLSALAIVPKAKAIAARRLSHSDYLELMRKRSVIEVTAALQSHPYFKDSLKGLSPNQPAPRADRRGTQQGRLLQIRIADALQLPQGQVRAYF